MFCLCLVVTTMKHFPASSLYSDDLTQSSCPHILLRFLLWENSSQTKNLFLSDIPLKVWHYRTWRIRRYGMGRASIPFILAHTNVLGWWWNLHSYRFAPIVFLWFAFVRLIERSCFDYHSHYTSSLITIDDFIFNVNIYPAWVIFNNLLLLLVLIAAAICSLIFLYAWVSVSVHGGGRWCLWHARCDTAALAL